MGLGFQIINSSRHKGHIKYSIRNLVKTDNRGITIVRNTFLKTGLHTRQPLIQNEKYQCRKDTVSSPDDGHIFSRNMQRSWNKYTKKYCAPSWLYLKEIIQVCTVKNT